MQTPGKLTVANLLKSYEALDADIKNDLANASFMVSSLVVKHFLGIKWLEDNVYPHPTKGGLWRLDEVITDETQIKSFRLIDLAELLMNLQHVEGFDQLIERMRTHDPEPYLAELRVGRILFINDAKFRFVPPTGKMGEDYDLEVTYPDGTTVCAETKCKIETTEATAKTIENALAQARKQLPKDKPGMIFVMIPQRWLEEGAGRLLIETVISFFNGNEEKHVPPASRIVSVKLYTEPLTFINGTMKQGHKYKEISNPHNKFHPHQNWNLFHYKPNSGTLGPDKWDALPQKWIRLVNFPHEITFPEGGATLSSKAS